MVKSLFVTASAGSGKTFRLTQEVRRHIDRDSELVVAVTFTRAAAAEMEKRILETIEKGPEGKSEKLRLIMRAARVHFSTIDALFHRFCSTEAYAPQVADAHETAIITALADDRFFQHPRILADIESILIATRILNLPPESLIAALDRSGGSLATWDCPERLFDEFKANQARIKAAYEQYQDDVRAAAGPVKGNLQKLVVCPLLEPIEEADLGKALFRKADVADISVAEADRRTAAYEALRDLYLPMRRLLAEYLINTKRLRAALLKRFSTLRAELLTEEKERLGRLYFEDIPRALVALDGPASQERPVLMARLYELGFHRTAHLLLDEFQDTSQVQFDLLRPLIEEILSSVGANAEGERSVFLVGDWKQAIYQWRDAAPDRLRDAIAPALESGQIAVETLPCNYRSTPLLIHFFNALVAELFAGTDKVHLQAPPDKPKHPYSGISEVAFLPAACDRGDEAAYARLVDALMQKKTERGGDWGDMAILCRTNGHMDKVAAALSRAGIPTSGIRGRELLSLREGAALYLALASVFTTADGLFVPRALAALGYGDSLTAILRHLAETVAASPRPHRFSAFAAALRDLMPHFPRALVETLWDEAEGYFDRPDAADAAAFLDYLRRMSHLVTVPEGEHADRVKLATIHSTKGLEFRHVFLFWKEALDRAPEIPHPDDGCPMSLTREERDFLAAGPIPGAAALAVAAEAVQEERADETANLLYVAATRAVQSLTIVLRADGRGALKGFGQRMVEAGNAGIPDAEQTPWGWRRDYGPEEPREADAEVLTAPDLAEGPSGEATADDMDPMLRSAAVEAGIERGVRIHAALARLTEAGEIPFPDNLSVEEREAVRRFVDHGKVREILFRPGTVLAEQHISDASAFGIVDRLVVAPDRITLIDFKTGRVGHLADTYRAQMVRYRTILQRLFGERLIEGFLLFVDEPDRIVAIS